MHKSYQCIKCYGRVLSIIYSIYKIKDPAFSCWPGKSQVHEEKEAETPRMLWLTLPVAPGRASISVFSLSATIYCNCLVACCRAAATQNKRAGLLSKGKWRLGHRGELRVNRELYSTDRRCAQLPTECTLVPFLVPADIYMSWVWWSRGLLKTSVFWHGALEHLILQPPCWISGHCLNWMLLAGGHKAGGAGSPRVWGLPHHGKERQEN